MSKKQPLSAEIDQSNLSPLSKLEFQIYNRDRETLVTTPLKNNNDRDEIRLYSQSLKVKPKYDNHNNTNSLTDSPNKSYEHRKLPDSGSPVIAGSYLRSPSTNRIRSHSRPERPQSSILPHTISNQFRERGYSQTDASKSKDNMSRIQDQKSAPTLDEIWKKIYNGSSSKENSNSSSPKHQYQVNSNNHKDKVNDNYVYSQTMRVTPNNKINLDLVTRRGSTSKLDMLNGVSNEIKNSSLSPKQVYLDKITNQDAPANKNQTYYNNDKENTTISADMVSSSPHNYESTFSSWESQPSRIESQAVKDFSWLYFGAL